MPIDEGVTIDLQFLILEVKKQAKASLSMIERPSANKLEKMRSREDYIENLKNTLENKSYYNLHQQSEGQTNYYKALITIASNLERCADFFTSVAKEMEHVVYPESFIDFDLRRYYQTIYRAIDAVFPAVTKHDLELAQKICDYEETLDEYYAESFQAVRSNLRQRRQVDDMLALLTIVRYLERAGDSFLNIGEAILDIHVGEKLGIIQFRSLKRGLESLNFDIRSPKFAFNSIMNTRSGCRVAKIDTGATSARARKAIFYKEGTRKKIGEELGGLKLWQEHFPGRTPTILWNTARKDSATMLLEYIEGHDLLEIMINHRSKTDQALKLLVLRLKAGWKKSQREKTQKSTYIAQLLNRKSDVLSMHADLFDDNNGFDNLLLQATKIENKIRVPFQTLIHGDFNADNIIFQLPEKKMFYVDVHRSGYGDYLQDVSVFMVSNIRIPVFSPDLRAKLNDANLKIYKCASDFAKASGDEYCDVRLALGLFRSLVTSTRFVFDKSFSSQLFDRGMRILRELVEAEKNLKQFSLREELFLYG